MFERYTEKARRVIFFARYEASQFGSPFIETEHLLLGIIREDKALTNRLLRSQVSAIRQEVENQTITREKVSTSVDLRLSNESKRVLAYAAEEAERLGNKHIGPEHLFLGLLREKKSFAAQILKERGIKLAEAREEISRLPSESQSKVERSATFGEVSPYVTDMTTQTQPLIGREKELEQLIELLCRFSKKNPVLVGEPGVGKRTIVGGLARRIAEGNAPSALAESAVVALDLPTLVQPDKFGLLYERLDSALVSAAEQDKIFFVNLLHDRSATSSPLPDLLQRAIVAGKVQCISTATPDVFARLQAVQHWLAQYFEPLHVDPASEEDAINVLNGIKGVHEGFHNVSYDDEAIRAAVSYAGRCVTKGRLPGSAVEVIDGAGAAAQLQQSSLPEEVVEVQKRIRFIVQRMEAAIANHEFEKARFYSHEEHKERDKLRELRKKYKLDESPAWRIRVEDIETTVSKLTGMPISAIRQARSDDSGISGSTQ